MLWTMVPSCWRFAPWLILLASSLAGCHLGPRGTEPEWSPAAWSPADSWSPASVPSAYRAVDFARGQLGKPYCYGGTGPACFDCSGLVYAAWSWAGRPVPRSSGALRDGLTRVPWASVQPGDVVWRPGHVGLYVGDGWVIHAPQTGKQVEYQPAEKYHAALRP
jgi:cell wall-associated NlpC family hydrolase